MQSIAVFDDGLAKDIRPLIITSKAHALVYIINGKEVTTVDLNVGAVLGHFDLDFTPHKATWLGIAAEEEHAH